MKVALVNPYPYYSTGIESTLYPPLGILYIGGYISSMVDSLLILDSNALHLGVEATYRKIIESEPDIIGISVNIATARAARELAELIRCRYKKALLVAGGPLPTVYPERWLDYVDVVIVGEGEIPFAEMIKRIKDRADLSSDNPGICIKGKPITRAPFADPDKIGYPAYEYLNPPLATYTKDARVVKPYMAPILTSRGCPYNCIFCDKSVHGSKFRPRSYQSVLDEANWLRTKFDVNQLDILDDNFSFDLLRTEKILNGLIRLGGFKINCQNGLRADKVNQELVKTMKKAGVFKVGIGIESGSISVLKRIDKKLDLEQVGKVIKWFRNERVTVHGYFILGFPFESADDIMQTLKFAIDVNPHFANFSNFLPIPGTKLYKELDSSNKLMRGGTLETECGFFRNDSLTAFENLTSEHASKLYKYVWRSFYLRPNKIIDILKTIKSRNEFIWILRISISIVKRRLFIG